MSGDDWNHGSVRTGYGANVPAPSRTLPVYLLFLIMLGSGIFTLVLLWVCVRYLDSRRRWRRSRADVERNGAPEQPRWEFVHGVAAVPPRVKEAEAEAKKCDGVELTYVVMAGEDQPTFLARPLRPSQDPLSPSAPP